MIALMATADYCLGLPLARVWVLRGRSCKGPFHDTKCGERTLGSSSDLPPSTLGRVRKVLLLYCCCFLSRWRRKIFGKSSYTTTATAAITSTCAGTANH